MDITPKIDLLSIELDQKQFSKISRTLYDLCGIKLHTGKEELVKARLNKRLQALGLRSFADYTRYVERDDSGKELAIMVDLLTTNKTDFFREQQHFDFMRRFVAPTLKNTQRSYRIWSAGCSSGEEPFSIAISLHEELSENDLRDVRILATDISDRMLTKARAGLYERGAVSDIPAPMLEKYFECVRTDDTEKFRVKEKVRAKVSFARLNLMDPWPMHGPFDVIFCRNVMIYFDKATQENLVNRFWQLLSSNGYLFVGHSESMASLSHPFHYVQPAIYRK